uniref:Uncharacterized protein n=1 Tax=Knipowitschia caucasica TaxID=637954 RepID=A0AAV2LZV0_KNICA
MDPSVSTAPRGCQLLSPSPAGPSLINTTPSDTPTHRHLRLRCGQGEPHPGDTEESCQPITTVGRPATSCCSGCFYTVSLTLLQLSLVEYCPLLDTCIKPEQSSQHISPGLESQPMLCLPYSLHPAATPGWVWQGCVIWWGMGFKYFGEDREEGSE